MIKGIKRITRGQQRVIVVLTATVVMAAGIIMGEVFTLHVEASYDDKVALGDYYASINEDAKAEIQYKQAIELNQKKPEAYDRLAVNLERQGRTDEAFKVREDKDRGVKPDINTGKAPAKPDPTKTTAKKTPEPQKDPGYVAFLKNHLPVANIPEEGVENSSNDKGLISYLRKDFNGDGSRDLLTVSIDKYCPLTVKIELCTNEGTDAGEDFKTVDTQTAELEDSSLAEDYQGGCFDLFTTTNADGDDYLFINKRNIGDTDGGYGGLLYEINEDGIEEVMDSYAKKEESDEESDEPESEPVFIFNDNEQSDLDEWISDTDTHLEKAGLECNQPGDDQDEEDVAKAMPEFDASDTDQTHLCKIKRGNLADNGYEMENDENSNQIFVEDFTKTKETVQE